MQKKMLGKNRKSQHSTRFCGNNQDLNLRKHAHVALSKVIELKYINYSKIKYIFVLIIDPVLNSFGDILRPHGICAIGIKTIESIQYILVPSVKLTCDLIGLLPYKFH